MLALRSPVRGAGIAAAVCALAGAANVSVGALDGRVATFAVWGLLGAACAVGAAYGPAPRRVRAGAAVCAVGYATGLLVAAAEGMWSQQTINATILSSYLGRKVKLPVSPARYDKMLADLIATAPPVERQQRRSAEGMAAF